MELYSFGWVSHDTQSENTRESYHRCKRKMVVDEIQLIALKEGYDPTWRGPAMPVAVPIILEVLVAVSSSLTLASSLIMTIAFPTCKYFA
jgi:hypothetical protein